MKERLGHVVVNDLGVSFEEGKWATKNVSLEVQPGEIVSLLGVSGSGKSTIINSIAGFVRPTTGFTSIDEKVTTGPSPKSAVVFQSFMLFPWMTVAANIAFGPNARGVERSETEERTEEFLQAVGLSGYGSYYPGDLSGGMQQRVALARALINHPSVLLLDEPYGALDAQTRVFMQELVSELCEKTHTSVLLVTHDVDEAVYLSDRVYVLTAGPGTIRDEFTIDLPRPRTPDMRMTKHFIEQKQRLLDAIKEESERVLLRPE